MTAHVLSRRDIMNAGEIMTSKVVTVRPDTNVAVAARLLLENKISAMPVVDNQDRVVGIISEGARTATFTKPASLVAAALS
jgi:CBS domain-containing protein